VSRAAPLLTASRTPRRSSLTAPVSLPAQRAALPAATLLHPVLPMPPHLTRSYLSADVDLDGVAALRESLKAQGQRVSVNDCVVKAVALALAEVPAANAYWDAAAEAVVPTGSGATGRAAGTWILQRAQQGLDGGGGRGGLLKTLAAAAPRETSQPLPAPPPPAPTPSLAHSGHCHCGGH
jgi:hypothetical protein